MTIYAVYTDTGNLVGGPFRYRKNAQQWVYDHSPAFLWRKLEIRVFDIKDFNEEEPS